MTAHASVTLRAMGFQSPAKRAPSATATAFNEPDRMWSDAGCGSALWVDRRSLTLQQLKDAKRLIGLLACSDPEFSGFEFPDFRTSAQINV